MISWFRSALHVPPPAKAAIKRNPCHSSAWRQKKVMALHMICFYGQPALREWFTAQYGKSGRKLDMGQGCLRFKTLPELALDVVENTVARLPVKEYVAGYQAARDAMKGKSKAKTRAPAKKTA